MDLHKQTYDLTFSYIYCNILVNKGRHMRVDMLGACIVMQYFICVIISLLYECLIIYLELVFKLYIVWIFRGSVLTLVYIYVYIDVFYIDACVGKWIFMLNWCLKCIFKHLYFYIWCSDELFVYSLYLYALKPISWILKAILSFLLQNLVLMHVLYDVFIFLCLCTSFYTL